MIVLHPNNEQYKNLNGYQNGQNVFYFATDGAGKYFAELSALKCEEWKEIHDQLNELKRIEYTPYPEE